MKSIVDELAGVLSPAELDKVKANQELFGRITKGADELYGFYKDDTVEAPTAATTTTTTTTAAAEPVRQTTAATGDIGSILRSVEGLTRKIDEKFNSIPDVVKTQVEEAVKLRGNDLVTAATTRALRQADELAKAREDWNRNYSDGGKVQFDSDAFEKYVNEQTEAGNRFASVTKAYESFVGPQKHKLEVANEVREELKKRNSNNLVPGNTPTGAKTTLATLMARGKTADGNGETAAQRAGASLDARLRSNE